MSENILVVEYEPRYTERVRAALAGQSFNAQFAKDGEEAMKALEASDPNLIVMSSVVPKISAPELIRAIRGRGPTQQTPILLTVSGYSGNAPKQDAVRMGASDILPKPYSETEFLGKVQQLLGVGQLTSKDIFGDVLSETVADGTAAAPPPAQPQPKKPAARSNDIDAMLDATLASVLPKKAKTAPGTTASILDKKLQDTLSGLEKSVRKRTSGGQAPAPVPTSVPTGEAPLRTGEAPVLHEDKVPVSQPVFPAAVPTPDHKEEEEPSDGVRFGQYVLQEKIATGGMAEVWKARMRGVEGFQKTVAIKKILPHLSEDKEFIEMFVDEAKLAAQLNHNNIIHIYDLGKIANSYYIAMEYVDGHDLKTILKRGEERHQPMSVELALFIASKIASALDYAHRKRDFDEKEMGLVHRDVSPQNVLVSEDGDIKLCDFGIAKAASKASHTQAGALKGKLQYMSPEQAWAKPIDRRSDIFALATVLYEMLTARKLFTGDNEISILEQVREARVTPPSKVNDEVTPEIDRIVLKALAKEPDQRYQTAGEMARDIDSLLYSFKPTPTSADLAIYMHHLWGAEPVVPRHEEPPTMVMDAGPDLALTPPPKAAPTLIETPVPGKTTLPGTTAPGNLTMPAWDAPRAKKKSMALPIAAGVVVVLAAGVGLVYMRSRNASASTPSSGPAATATHAPVTAAPAPVTTASVAPAATQTTASAAQAPPPALDPNAINEEVQKRLAAERARLDEQQRRQIQQQQQQQAAARQPLLNGGGSVSQAIVPRPAPAQQPVQQQAQTQTVAPPVQTNTQPAPPPTATQAVATQEAAPPPAIPRAREGDLVAAGTEGLAPARILRRGSVPYPAMARQEHIEGTVILNVLVNENGQVLDVKVVRGRPAGLNEAAIAIVRRSAFAPPTKDGVRVKSWTTVPVDFKL